MTGRFITLEGGEGTGKSTQAKSLVHLLNEKGVSAILTREPGGSEGAECIRKVLVEGEPSRWDALTEYLLFSAARRDHIEKTIKPALSQGTWVICDRFLDSSRVYQGLGKGLSSEIIETLYQIIAGSFEPDLTLIFDAPMAQALARTQDRDIHENRFERMDSLFHEQVREAYRQIAKDNPKRCRIIDASQDLEAVTQAIHGLIVREFKL